MSLNELKMQYNKLLLRSMKAQKYYSDKSIPETEKKKYEPKLIEIFDRMDSVLIKIRDEYKVDITEDIVINGFLN